MKKANVTTALRMVEMPPRDVAPVVLFAGPEIFSEWEIPVPGIDTVLRTPRLPMLTLAPRPPSVVLTPDFDTFMRMPGAILMRLLKRNAIVESHIDFPGGKLAPEKFVRQAPLSKLD